MRVLNIFILTMLSCSTSNSESLISVEDFDQLRKKEKNYQLIDLRTAPEINSTGVIENAIHKSYFDSDFNSFVEGLSRDKTYIVYCRSGGRSARATKIMKQRGLTVFDLEGGMNTWLEMNRVTTKVSK